MITAFKKPYRYWFLALFSVFLGMFLSLLMRYHMVYPDAKVGLFEKLWPTGAAGGIMTPELYLSLMTMHGTIMVFFVLTTAPQGGFGNYFLPIQIGAEDMAFPARNSGRTKRWNEIPEAFAAVSSEWRPSAPTVNTVANNTATGSTRNIFSGRSNTYDSATAPLLIPRLM